MLLYITVLAIWNLPFITAAVSAEICFTTIMMMLLAMNMARTAAEDYYAYWESGNEQKIEQMAEKALWLGLVLAAAGAWAYYMDEMNQMGAGGGGTGGTGAKGLVGKDFENYLTKTIGGNGSFSVDGREFDGGIDGRWWEAKSGNYWNMLEDNPNMLSKFQSDMGDRLRIATENGATYELFSNTPIPDSIKQWLTKKGIFYTEILE